MCVPKKVFGLIVIERPKKVTMRNICVLAGQGKCSPDFSSLASDREICECETELALHIY